MQRFLSLMIILFLLAGCSASDIQSVTNIVTSKDPVSSLGGIAKNKAVRYAESPEQIQKDINYIKRNFDQILQNFVKLVSGEWGEENVKEPSQKKYVKYTQGYKSRAEVDFDKGLVTVETVEEAKPVESLREAIVTTILTPDDPRSIDLYSAKEVELKGTPYLGGMIKDHQEKIVLYKWRAQQYAKYLTANKLQTKTIAVKGKNQKLYFVQFPLIKGHTDVRARKYQAYVEEYARKYRLDKALVYAIIETESNFNPYAVSHVPAYGLMQVVPKSAGRDAHRQIHARDGIPTQNQLFNPKTNILYGTTYLHILNEKYLSKISNPISKEYCVISAYNTGSGNVLKTFSKDRSEAYDVINTLDPKSVFWKLKTQLPYDETRRYIVKVTDAKKTFIGY